MKLNGWARIGIVVSIVWILAIAGMAIYEFRAHRTTQTNLIVWKAKTGEDHAQVSKTTGQFADLVPLHASLTPRFFGFLLLPILCGWILSYILVYTLLWILKGFRTKRT